MASAPRRAKARAHRLALDFLPQHFPLGATLTNPAREGRRFRFDVASEVGAAFEVQFSTNLNSWTPLGFVTNLNGTLTVTNLPAAGPKGFFRLKNTSN